MKYIAGEDFSYYSFLSENIHNCYGIGLHVFLGGMSRKKTFFSGSRLVSIRNTEVPLLWVSFYPQVCK